MASNSVIVCKLGAGLDELVASLAWGLGEVGYSAQVHAGAVDYNSINILLAAFKLDYAQISARAPRSINYNIEQIGAGPREALSPRYFSLMRNFPNWDYSQQNIAALKATGICGTTLVPIGYAPSLERILPEDKDIDVLFFGSRNDRRYRVLKAMEDRGLKVVWTNAGEWTPIERDRYIARAKVVLNMGFYDNVHVFEEVRVSYLLANRVAVVSELTPDTFIEEDMRRCVVGAPLDQLPDLCAEYCANARKRAALAETGYAVFRSRDWLTPLRNAMAAYTEHYPVASSVAKLDVVPPAKISIGSGRRWRHDAINIDLDTSCGADILFDMSARFPYENWLTTWRFGKISLQRGSIDHIWAEHVLESVADMVQCMTTCIEWLRIGGVMEIDVAYDLAYGAWLDPKHVRAFNERSWEHFTDQCWQVGWREFRFDIASHTHVLSDTGQALVDGGMNASDIVRVPRAVDSLLVKLVKRELTAAEKEEHSQYFQQTY